MYLFLCSKQVKKRFFYIIYLKSVKECSAVARLWLKVAGGNEKRRGLLPCRRGRSRYSALTHVLQKCTLDARNFPFSLLFGVFNNNFKVFVFIGFVIIYFYNIFALIKKLFKFLSKMLFTLASRSACLFMPFFACFSLFRSYIARYAPLKNKKTF